MNSLPLEHRKRGWQRWMQFRLRAALLLLLACSFGFAWIRYRLDSYQKQHVALAKVGELAIYIGMKQGSPNWLGSFTERDKFTDVVHLSFHDSSKFSDVHLAQLRNFPRLYRLSLHRTGITDDGLKHLAELSELDTVSLKRTRITDVGIGHLVGLPKLKVLQLSDSKVSRNSIQSIAQLKSLEFLEISHVSLEDEDIRLLAKLPRLARIVFRGDKLTPTGVAHLSSIKSLESLTFYERVPKRIKLHGLPNLRSLLVTSESTAASFSLKNLPKLNNLQIRVRHLTEFTVSDLPGVTSLHLVYMGISDEAFSQLANLHQLVHLSLRGARFKYELLPKLATLQNLLVLELAELHLTDDDLKYLSNIRRLEWLDLSFNQIRGHGLASLQPLQKLKNFQMTGSRPRTRRFKTRSLYVPDSKETLTLDGGFNAETAFRNLVRLKSLEHIDMSEIPATAEQLLILREASALKTLLVNTLDLDDEELANLSKILPLNSGTPGPLVIRR